MRQRSKYRSGDEVQVKKRPTRDIPAGRYRLIRRHRKWGTWSAINMTTGAEVALYEDEFGRAILRKRVG